MKDSALHFRSGVWGTLFACIHYELTKNERRRSIFGHRHRSIGNETKKGNCIISGHPNRESSGTVIRSQHFVKANEYGRNSSEPDLGGHLSQIERPGTHQAAFTLDQRASALQRHSCIAFHCDHALKTSWIIGRQCRLQHEP